MKSLGILLMACAGVACAEESPAGKIPPELRSCVDMERSSERLACFDRGIAAILQGDAAAAPSKESTFGLMASTPHAEKPDGGASEELKTIRGKVVAVNTAGGDAVVTLDNGQVWRQLSGGQLLLKAGDEVEINRAALGSFQMKVPSGRSGKVKRVR